MVPDLYENRPCCLSLFSNRKIISALNKERPDFNFTIGKSSKNISIIVPQGETIESCGHNTRGKDKISYDEVLSKALELIN